VKLQEWIDLIKTRVEILKLKADVYNWQCHTPEKVRFELEKALVEIDARLASELVKNETHT
jgi:hypothetical protein